MKTSRSWSMLALALLLGGCATSIPGWVPFFGNSEKRESSRSAADAPAKPKASAKAKTRGVQADAEAYAVDPEDEKANKAKAEKKEESTASSTAEVADRIVAVVNNDAITLAELQENLLVYKQENRQASSLPSDDEMYKQFISRLIDTRVQLQEADREKITADEQEIDEELSDRLKKMNVGSKEELEASLKAQGLTLDAVKKRLRESIRIAKLVRRKVALRVSVTEQEIDRYLEENRAKLETGLSYHARHILIVPEDGPADQMWEAARIKAELVRKEIAEGADFAEVAKKHSKDASAKDGGDLGSLKRGELSTEIEDQILRLKPGEVSPPFRSKIGWHIFRLESKESLEGDGLVRVKQQIREILFREKYEARLDAWLKEIKQRAVIDVRI